MKCRCAHLVNNESIRFGFSILALNNEKYIQLSGTPSPAIKTEFGEILHKQIDQDNLTIQISQTPNKFFV